MKKYVKRFLTALLCMSMLMGLIPQLAFAATVDLTEEQLAALTTPLLNSTAQVPDTGSGADKVATMLSGTGYTLQDAAPDNCKFKAASGDTKEYILLRSVNAADGDGYFILSNTVDMNSENASAFAPFYSDTTNYRYDPDDTKSIASKLNADDYISTQFPAMSNYIQSHTWYTEAIKSAVKAYSVNAKIALLSLTEYRTNADRIGINVNGRNWMTRTPNGATALWFFSSSGIGGTNMDSTSSWLQIRPCFYVSEDFFKNVRLDTSCLTVDSEISKLIVKLDSEGKLAENLYTDEELTVMGKSSGTSIENLTVSGTGNLGDTVTAEYTVSGTAPASCKFKWINESGTSLGETDQPTFTVPYSALGGRISCTVEAYNSEGTLIATAAASNSITTEAKPVLKTAVNAALTGFADTTPDAYKFNVGGSDFILLKSVNADEKDGYFVVKDKQVLFDSNNNKHYFYNDGDDTPGNAEFKFDPADEKSIANYINSSEYMDIAESYAASRTKAIPADIRNHIKEHDWWVDGTSTIEPYKIKAKITIMSYTEYMENIDRIGITNEHNRYWYLRSPVTKTNVSVVNGNSGSANYGKSASETVDSWYPSHRPCFYIDSSFFKQNKLTFTAANTELIKTLRKELTFEEAVNLGYSGTELKLMGYDIDDLYFTNLEASQGDDGKYTISFGVENTTSESLSFNIIAALYNGSCLTSTSIPAAVTLEAGAYDNTLTAVVDAKGISAETLKLKIFAWNNLTECRPLCTTPIDNYLSAICAGDKK